MNWLTITTTLIAAIAPSVVAIISSHHQTSIAKQNNELQLSLSKQNNDYQIRLKELEHYYAERTIAINNFIDSIHTYLNDKTDDNLLNYNLASSKVCLYLSSDRYYDVSEITRTIKEERPDSSIRCVLRDFLSELNKEAQQYINKD